VKTIEIYEYGDLINVTITVPRYQTNKSKNGINEKIKLDLPAVQNILKDQLVPSAPTEYHSTPIESDLIIAALYGTCVKNNTLDNRAGETCSATWIFKKTSFGGTKYLRNAPDPPDPPEAPATIEEAPAYTAPEAKPEPPKPKKTTRRRRTRKTTKKTETEV